MAAVAHQLPDHVDTQDPESLVAWAVERFHPRLVVASSFSLEDVLVVSMAASVMSDIRVVSLDTGRLPEETYTCAEALRRRLGIQIEWYFPRSEQVESLERTQGLYSFRDSLTARKQCCHVRKVEPLQRALRDVDAWITGQRRAQSVTRAGLDAVEQDVGTRIKVNPLAAWSLQAVRQEVERRGLPIHQLYSQGFASIGCAPCTRAIQPHEDERAGRWWWERADHKECGLHTNGGQQ